MTRGDEGNRDYVPSDAFTVVRDFMDRIGDREPTAEEISEVRPALEELYQKLERIRKMSPATRKVDVSERVWGLLRRIGKKPLPVPRRPFGRAASFL